MRAGLLAALLGFATSVSPAAISAPGDTPPAGGEWQKLRDEDGIVVYQRQLKDVDTISMRGEAVLAARLEDIVDVMKNNAETHEWMPLVRAKRDLQSISENERIELTHIHLPWPLADRLFINQAKAEYLPAGVVRLSVKSVDAAPAAFGVQLNGKVLGVLHYSEFVLTPQSGGESTHMAIEVNSDPKGLIPKWMVNAGQRSWPRDFFTGLIQQLRKHGKLR